MSGFIYTPTLADLTRLERLVAELQERVAALEARVSVGGDLGDAKP